MEHTKTSRKNNKNTMGLISVIPQTNNQKKFFDKYNSYDVISLSGFPGTGKTFIAMYKALEEFQRGQHTSVTIIRSAVTTRDIGFLPGNAKEKMSVYEAPYVAIVNELYNRGDSYDILKQKKQVDFIPTSYLRGRTFNNTIIVIDEAQNMSYQELYTVLTRIGKNCKVLVCGDVAQDDLTSKRYNTESGYKSILSTLRKMQSVLTITMHPEDIVRSGFVKEFILATHNVVDDRLASSKKIIELVG